MNGMRKAPVKRERKECDKLYIAITSAPNHVYDSRVVFRGFDIIRKQQRVYNEWRCAEGGEAKYRHRLTRHVAA